MEAIEIEWTLSCEKCLHVKEVVMTSKFISRTKYTAISRRRRWLHFREKFHLFTIWNVFIWQSTISAVVNCRLAKRMFGAFHHTCIRIGDVFFPAEHSSFSHRSYREWAKLASSYNFQKEFMLKTNQNDWLIDLEYVGGFYWLTDIDRPRTVICSRRWKVTRHVRCMKQTFLELNENVQIFQATRWNKNFFCTAQFVFNLPSDYRIFLDLKSHYLSY